MMFHWEKKYYDIRIKFQEWVAHTSIRLYGFSMHQIFKMKLLTLSLLRKR